MTTMKISQPDESDFDGWTLAELVEARHALEEEISRLRGTELASELEFGADARRDAFDGDDIAYVGTLVADMGAGTLLADNTTAILEQCQRALDRIAQLRYGICDECCGHIDKARLKVMPRATLCITCQAKNR